MNRIKNSIRIDLDLSGADKRSVNGITMVGAVVAEIFDMGNLNNEETCFKYIIK